MRLLLDTHIVLWLATEREKLSPTELGWIVDPDNEFMISAVSVWELRIKWHSFFASGERKGPIDPARLLYLLGAMKLEVEPLATVHAAAPLRSPLQHSDPFDDLLLTIAQETGRLLLTRDTRLRGHAQAIHAD